MDNQGLSTLLRRVDWEQLRAQKAFLVETVSEAKDEPDGEALSKTSGFNTMEGLISFLDAVQDAAAIDKEAELLEEANHDPINDDEEL